MARFGQVCGSQNHLFALDEDGNVYEYRFTVKTWVRLSTNRESSEKRPSAVAGRS